MAALTASNSNLFNGPLQNVLINFDGDDLGKTTEDTVLSDIQDVKEIFYSQDGTQPADHIVTGHAKQLTATFGEIRTTLFEKLLYGFSSEAANPSVTDSGTFGTYLYQSLKTNKAKKLIVTAIDSNGIASTSAEDILNLYVALPIVEETNIIWGAETQINIPVRFYIYLSKFGASQVSGGPAAAFGYYGSATTEKVPAIASYPA